MVFKASKIRHQYNENHKLEIILTTENTMDIMANLNATRALAEKGKELEVEVKQYRVKRSLDANAYMWLLLSKMADVLRTTKDELYLLMLERYGVFTHIVVKPNVVEKVKQEWRTVRELGEVTVNGKTGIQLQCFFGSSTYDTKEMSVLIDGVVSECEEIGIETLTPAELALLKTEWDRKAS
jgi:hypothetical protein